MNSSCGFGNPLSFKSITDDDINFVEDSIKQKAQSIFKNIVETKSVIEYDTLVNIFGENYAAKPNEFTFLRGERKLINELVQHVEKEVNRGGINCGIVRFRKTSKEPEDDMKCANCQTNEKQTLSNTQAHYFLKKLINAADRNSTRDKGGYRYDDDIKLFAAILRMVTGPLAYEILQKNLECALPSLSSTNRYIRQSNCRIDEAILRIQELKIYLLDRNLPLVVALSEDATRICGRVQYDSLTNQLMGFVLPINQQNGMPIPFSFPARNAEQIIHHFSNDNNISPFLNVVMAQPIAPNTPAFCLLVFSSDCSYTSKDVMNRWLYIATECANSNIQVLTISSDSDPKYNGAMRRLSQLGSRSPEFPKWFSCANMCAPFYMQDLIHIATKMRNFLLRMFWKKRCIPFGVNFVKMEHLFVLIDNVSKDHHELTASILTPTDRQNYSSVLRMCNSKVINLLRSHVKDSEATIIFLQILRDIIDSHIDKNLNPLQRIRKLWYSLFLIRIWRQFIVSSKNYTLKNHFLTNNCYSCIELNAHNLVWIIIYLKNINKPELFLPLLFSSQPCENLFRLLRSFTTTYSTVANCTAKEAISRISKIQFQNEIMYATSPHFIYPRLKENSSAEKTPQCYLPSRDQIINGINFCLNASIATAKRVGLIKSNSKNKMYLCKINPNLIMKKSVKKCCMKQKSIRSLRSVDLKNIQLKDFSHKAKTIDGSSPYTEILCSNNKRVIVKKTSLCWLLNPGNKKLSSDRLQRVRYSAKSKKSKPKRKKSFIFDEEFRKKLLKKHIPILTAIINKLVIIQ